MIAFTNIKQFLNIINDISSPEVSELIVDKMNHEPIHKILMTGDVFKKNVSKISLDKYKYIIVSKKFTKSNHKNIVIVNSCDKALNIIDKNTAIIDDNMLLKYFAKYQQIKHIYTNKTNRFKNFFFDNGRLTFVNKNKQTFLNLIEEKHFYAKIVEFNVNNGIIPVFKSTINFDDAVCNIIDKHKNERIIDNFMLLKNKFNNYYFIKNKNNVVSCILTIPDKICVVTELPKIIAESSILIHIISNCVYGTSGYLTVFINEGYSKTNVENIEDTHYFMKINKRIKRMKNVLPNSFKFYSFL